MDAAPDSHRDEGLSRAGREIALQVWADAIGADEVRPGAVTMVLRDDLDAVVAVEICGCGMVATPSALEGTVRGLPGELLRDADALAAALAAVHPRASPLGSADLLFRDRALTAAATVRPASSADVDLFRSQSDDREWGESGLESMGDHRVAVTPAGEPAALAGFEPWRDRIAQVGVLTRPGFRSRGWGAVAAAAAVRSAVEAGLVAQWRSRRGNAGSLALAERLGFVALGVQSTVVLE